MNEKMYGESIITEKEILCVKIAGLCHDLGHGPFSHLFDGNFIPRSMSKESKWSHEQGSCDLFDYMIEKNEKLQKLFERRGINENEKKLIKSMIMGELDDSIKETTMMDVEYQGKTCKKQFLLEIVSNKATGIDCDKFDYFARDTHHVGIPNSFDFKRYFKNIRIMPIEKELRICARDKEESNLLEMFHIRWTLHRKVYQHKTIGEIGELLTQALLLADSTFKISSSINDMDQFTSMTDSIFFEILRSKIEYGDVKKAKEILQKIQCRELYQYCGQFNPSIVGQITPEKAVNGISSFDPNYGISPDDICVLKAYFSYGKKEKNPLKKMSFFQKNGELKQEGQLTDICGLLPTQFEEEYLRVYSKDKDKKQLVEKALDAWCKENGFRP